MVADIDTAASSPAVGKEDAVGTQRRRGWRRIIRCGGMASTRAESAAVELETVQKMAAAVQGQGSRPAL